MTLNGTLFGQMITFALFVMFTMRYVWPPMVKSLEDRRLRIAEGLAEAEKGRKALEDATLVSAREIQRGKETAQGIVEEAHKRASLILEEARKQIREEQALEIARAQAEIQQLTASAREALRDRIAEFVADATARLVKHELDAKKHESLVREAVEGF